MSEKSLTTRVVTDRVFLNFPHLVKPQEQKNSKYSSAPRYGATIIIPKEDETTLNKIRVAINNAIEIGGFNVNDNIKNPLKDGDVVYPGEELFLNSMFINASTPIQPAVIDHNLKRILGRYDEFPCGTIAKLSLKFKAYKGSDGNNIFAQLENVQILPGNRLLDLRAKPEDDFVVEK